MKRIVVGLMSGTSMDGIDASVIEIVDSGEKKRIHPLSFITTPYPREIRESLLEICRGRSLRSGVAEVSSIHFKLGELFAQAAVRAVRKAGRSLKEIDLIGSHGQTIHHHPGGPAGSTLQLGEPAIIAERTGVTTVADFRPADVAAGGEGAPLVPYVHYLLFRNKRRSRAIHNLGGISNLTYIPAGGGSERRRGLRYGSWQYGDGRALPVDDQRDKGLRSRWLPGTEGKSPRGSSQGPLTAPFFF